MPSLAASYFLIVLLPKVKGHRHFIDLTLDLLKGIGIPSKNRTPAIYLWADEQAWVGQWLQEMDFKVKKIVAIHPGAYYETQRWLPEYYAELIELIRRQTQLDVILIGGAADAKVVDDITIQG